MAAPKPELRPVQIFLDTNKFISVPPAVSTPRAHKDFYAGNDRGFSVQKTRIRKRLIEISDAMKARGEPAGFLRVQMKDDALAKSYRPLGKLFTEQNSFAFVGTERVGELLIQATPQALEKLEKLIEEKAEPTPEMVVDKKTGQLVPRVSQVRSEVGGLDSVSLYTSRERVPFSAEEAVEWLRQPGVIGGYVVELFRPNSKLAPQAIRALVDDLRNALSHLPFGIVTRSFLPSESAVEYGEPSLAISVQLTIDKGQKDIELPFANGSGLFTDQSVSEKRLTPNLRIQDHQAALALLSSQTLVRSVELPPLVEAAPAGYAAALPRPAVHKPAPKGSYPVVGIIDGGVADIPELAPWRVGDAGLVPAVDRDDTHGTFIAGLVVAGGLLNPDIAGELEGRGCKFFDLGIFPRIDLRQDYFGQDVEYFFDLLDEKIKIAKRDHGVRIFNFSFGIQRFTLRSSYTPWADRLDRIARANDVILVISAGNLPGREARPPWPAKPDTAVTMLANFPAGNQQILPPSEHLLGITVGALNPPGIKGHEPGLPTTYTRRGPGVGGARKPDISHYGGVESGAGRGNRTGLISLSPTGEAIENCGTSFAAPNAAATIATLDHRLEQGQPRELLFALPVHRARRGKVMSASVLRHISRDFVGFGLPPTADAMLMDDPYGITLVFTARLRRRQVLEFQFAWPAALVTDSGACRGCADLTLAYTPPIDAAHKDEALRVQLEAHLKQEALDEDGKLIWDSQLKQDGSGVPQGMNKTEAYLLKTGLKWSPIKRYSANMSKGRGERSTWQLSVDSQQRAGAPFPDAGVPFAVILTISDPRGLAPIHDAVRNTLQAQGHALADIMVAHRIRPRSS
ncbi:MAG TPA: S8 family serine peptidase [Rhizomicrobium sp.]|nr:S8 family serine peptidase [Rhizomicrobium sp.]